MVIELTDKAKERLNELFQKNKSDKHLRIHIAAFGWGGQTFGMVLDEPSDYDIKISEDGFDFIVDQGFEERYSGFAINYSSSFFKKGFTVTPQRRPRSRRK